MKPESILRRTVTSDILFVVAYWCASFMLMVIFLREIYSPQAISTASAVISACADALLFVLPFLWIPRRWRWCAVLAILAILLLSGWLYANVLYFRNFDDVIPASLYSLHAVANEYVMNGVRDSVRLADLLYLLPLIVVISALSLCGGAKPGRRLKSFYILLTILFCLLAMLLGIRRNASWNGLEISASLKKYVTAWNERTDWHTLVAYYGIWGYGMNVIENRITEGISLTPQQRRQIACELAAVSESRLPAGAFDFNRGKNLIIIIVESLGSSVLSLDDFPQIAPTLNNIVSDTSNLVVPDMRVVAGYGRSADGQFICNTGLYPLRDDAFTLNYATADYPSLAKALTGYESQEIICESRNLWQHSSTTLSYGFNSLSDNAGTDAEMFSRAIQSLSAASKPIFLFITTIAMHDPYDKYNSEITSGQDITLAEIGNVLDRNYLSQLAYFDNQLGIFLTDLQRKKLVDGSIIVITGDHEPRKSGLSEQFEDSAVPFVILNPGKAVECVRDVSQIDIFPTLLDVMGVDIYKPASGNLKAWRGFGRSLFVDDKNPLEEGKMRALSDTIIRSRWFLERSGSHQ